MSDPGECLLFMPSIVLFVHNQYLFCFLNLNNYWNQQYNIFCFKKGALSGPFSEPCQTSKMKRFVRQGSEYTSDIRQPALVYVCRNDMKVSRTWEPGTAGQEKSNSLCNISIIILTFPFVNCLSIPQIKNAIKHWMTDISMEWD